jgi:hypothetical protein
MALDQRMLDVLSRALRSSSRVTRVRAVSMLARVRGDRCMAWLEEALADSDEAVSATATCALAWVVEADDPPWPQREDPSFDRIADQMTDDSDFAASTMLPGWQWEYVLEVWRDDGLLLGVFLATTCAEDDEHAKRIALGQAILANAGGRGDAFDASTAAAFIVGKRRLPGRSGRPDGKRRGRGRTV